MGIGTVAVYSDADSRSLHVEMADEAINIGGAASSESYLHIDNILAAVEKTGAQAVHPGFGFLSENAEFATALEKLGVRFIGPGIRAIATMGDKIESKKLAERAGVNTIPGHTAALASAAEALEIAERVGCPVMIKASAGGGGKGMRIAWSLDDVAEGFESAANEARNSFGDDRVFIEKYIESPRHIEIQVLADQHGECIYLGERECSIQRRHQKVIEEAPSPFIDDTTRRAMGEQAVGLARAVDYCSAGTVEFIVDQNRHFYFLEMNTRLQVEHPVTEYITGIDLVEQMIRVAYGMPLGMTQQDVRLNGWAIEARIYAEDPDRNFMPSTGRLTRYQPPRESDCVRVDTGVYEGAEISVHYDPMIAKLIASGETRGEAIATMANALDDYLIRGVSNNISFLASVVQHTEFKQGNLSTGFIDQYFPDGFNAEHRQNDSIEQLTAIAATLQHERDSRENCHSGESALEYMAIVDGQVSNLTCSMVGSDYEVSVNGRNISMRRNWNPGQIKIQVVIDSENFVVQADRDKIYWVMRARGVVARIAILSRRAGELFKMMPEKIPPDTSKFLLTPMPGLLVRLLVEEGDRVRVGQDLAVVEAMKMENTLSAERAGVVMSIAASRGDSLSVDQVILEFE